MKSVRPSPLTSIGIVEKQFRYVPLLLTLRTGNGVQAGPLYHCSPDTMSSLPSPSTSNAPAPSKTLLALISCLIQAGSAATAGPAPIQAMGRASRATRRHGRNRNGIKGPRLG